MTGVGGKCCVVNAQCEAPANGPGTVRTMCFACGQPVCRPCSKVRTWYRWRNKRVCATCAEQEANGLRNDRQRRAAYAKKDREWKANGKVSAFCVKGEHGWCANRDWTESHCQCACHKTRVIQCPTCGGRGKIIQRGRQ